MAPLPDQPVGVELDRAVGLRVTWGDGTVAVLPLDRLRAACPCAGCRAERESQARDGLPVVPTAEQQRAMTAVRQIELVGRYALRVCWEDGHNTGIYDFGLLRTLGHRHEPCGCRSHHRTAGEL